MNNANYEIVLDIGSSKIRATAFHKSDSTKNFYLEGKFFTNFKDLESEIQKIISILEVNTGEYLENVNLLVDNQKTLSVNLSLFKNFEGLKLKNEDIQFLIQDGKQQIVENYPDQNIMHIIVKDYKINNVYYDSLPMNINCNFFSVDIIFVCLPKILIQDLKNFFSNLNIFINQTCCSSYAKSLNYRNNFALDKNISFIDMGFNKTSIINFDKNKINFINYIPIGGNHITKDLSKVLNIDFDHAEKIKLNFDNSKDFLNDKKLSHELIQKIIFARVEEILELCNFSIKLTQNSEQLNDFQMILMGEGSKILDNKFKDKISFSKEIHLLEENTQEICESFLKLNEEKNNQEVIIVQKKPEKQGFFEKLFYFFR